MIERVFNLALKNYLQFAESTLKAKLPYRFIAGATDVNGFRMVAPEGKLFSGLAKFGGNFVQEHIVFDGAINDNSKQASEILRPFYECLWEECGLERPDVQSLA